MAKPQIPRKTAVKPEKPRAMALLETAQRLAKRASLESEFSMVLLGLRELPTPVREFKFADDRQWRFDFAWPDQKIAVEIHGGTYMNGGHNRPLQFKKDCDKHNRAVLLGWRVFLFTTDHIKSGEAYATLRLVFDTK